MPGSIITCTGLSATYNSTYNVRSYRGTTNFGLSVNTALDTFNIDLGNTNVPGAFPFNTGDIVFLGDTVSGNTFVSKFFAIRVSSSAIKLATSYSNAINGIAIDQTVDPGTTSLKYQLSNSPFGFEFSDNRCVNNEFFDTSFWQSSASSVNTFSRTDAVAMRFTLPTNGGAFVGIKTVGATPLPAYGVGLGAHSYGVAGTLGRELVSGVGTRFVVLSGGVYQNNWEIKLQNSRISIAYQPSFPSFSTTYTTLYTTPVLTTNLPLRFFSYFNINNTQLTNCVLTYL